VRGVLGDRYSYRDLLHNKQYLAGHESKSLLLVKEMETMTNGRLSMLRQISPRPKDFIPLYIDDALVIDSYIGEKIIG